ncbi:MAG: cysteine desulfurase [Alphaproteobacteria bacterium]|nr:cysteine desulfurase [Alphaproteobacteria bacterium]
MRPVYLDFNASTPIAPEVAEAMGPFLSAGFGNPSSPHWAGRSAREAVDHARAQVAALLGCAVAEVIFTSGGTEANNLALKGVFDRRAEGRDHIITTAVEHPSVLNPCRYLERHGARLTVLPVDGTGLVDPEAVARAITGRTLLVSVMHANNEVGTLQPVADIARVAHEREVLVHVDAAQSAGKVPAKVDDLGADLLSVAGHKLYAPKGVGALYVRSGTALEPLLHGAGHEGGRRAGTESALLVTGLGAACALGAAGDVLRLRDRFWALLREAFGDGVRLNGHPERRLPNTVNVSFVGRDGAALLARLEGVAATTGSACHAGRTEPSPVLTAMGVPADVARGAIRFSLGRTTTDGEIDRVVELLRRAIGEDGRG